MLPPTPNLYFLGCQATPFGNVRKFPKQVLVLRDKFKSRFYIMKLKEDIEEDWGTDE